MMIMIDKGQLQKIRNTIQTRNIIIFNKIKKEKYMTIIETTIIAKVQRNKN